MSVVVPPPLPPPPELPTAAAGCSLDRFAVVIVGAVVTAGVPGVCARAVPARELLAFAPVAVGMVSTYCEIPDPGDTPGGLLCEPASATGSEMSAIATKAPVTIAHFPRVGPATTRVR